MYAEFTDDLITGNQTIDNQHRELIERINRLLVNCEECPSRGEAARLLNYLADYTDYHFSEEEALQKSIGYPGMAEHIKKHEEFRQAVQELHEMLEEEEGPSDAFAACVKERVRDWLYYHIQTFDRSVAEYNFMRDNPDLV